MRLPRAMVQKPTQGNSETDVILTSVLYFIRIF